MPTRITGHRMVTYGTDLVVMGGYKYCYQLSCQNGIFHWEKMKPELKFSNSEFVAMTIPDHLVDQIHQ